MILCVICTMPAETPVLTTNGHACAGCIMGGPHLEPRTLEAERYSVAKHGRGEKGWDGTMHSPLPGFEVAGPPEKTIGLRIPISDADFLKDMLAIAAGHTGGADRVRIGRLTARLNLLLMEARGIAKL